MWMSIQFPTYSHGGYVVLLKVPTRVALRPVKHDTGKVGFSWVVVLTHLRQRRGRELSVRRWYSPNSEQTCMNVHLFYLRTDFVLHKKKEIILKHELARPKS